MSSGRHRLTTISYYFDYDQIATVVLKALLVAGVTVYLASISVSYTLVHGFSLRILSELMLYYIAVLSSLFAVYAFPIKHAREKAVTTSKQSRKGVSGVHRGLAVGVLAGVFTTVLIYVALCFAH